MFKSITKSAEQTLELGKGIGSLLGAGHFVTLDGELGTGKTALAKGIAKGVGVSEDVSVTSPTYTILNIYQGKVPLYHFDLYRLAAIDDFYELGFEEYLDASGVVLVEWSGRLSNHLPENRIEISITAGENHSRYFNIGIKGEFSLLFESHLKKCFDAFQ